MICFILILNKNCIIVLLKNELWILKNYFLQM